MRPETIRIHGPLTLLLAAMVAAATDAPLWAVLLTVRPRFIH